MSSLIATVKQIEKYENLHIVKFDCNAQSISMMSLDLSDRVQVGSKVKLVIKSSHILIAKNFTGNLSTTNQLETTIKSCENGKLLSSVKLDFFDTTLESIITLNASKKMNLKTGDKVIALINESEISIDEVLS